MQTDDIWNDDDCWWHQQDLELQQQEAERIARCNAALAELDSIINDELNRITRGIQ